MVITRYYYRSHSYRYSNFCFMLSPYTFPGLSTTGPIRIMDIANFVCQEYHVTMNQLRSKKRTRDLVISRQVYCFLCRNYTTASLQVIGNLIYRDHATVLYSANVVRDTLLNDRRWKNRIQSLIDVLEKEKRS